MGSFSIWHWLIVIVVLMVLFGVPFLIVKFANPNKHLARLPYFFQAVAMIIISYIASEITENISNSSTETLWQLAVVSILQVIAFVYGTLITVYRLQDLAWNKWFVFIGIIPFINLAFICVLFFNPGIDHYIIDQER